MVPTYIVYTLGQPIGRHILTIIVDEVKSVLRQNDLWVSENI
jgi:hypothetical protein